MLSNEMLTVKTVAKHIICICHHYLEIEGAAHKKIDGKFFDSVRVCVGWEILTITSCQK